MYTKAFKGLKSTICWIIMLCSPLKVKQLGFLACHLLSRWDKQILEDNQEQMKTTKMKGDRRKENS
jgi:hypothetical protein